MGSKRGSRLSGKELRRQTGDRVPLPTPSSLLCDWTDLHFIGPPLPCLSSEGQGNDGTEVLVPSASKWFTILRMLPAWCTALSCSSYTSPLLEFVLNLIHSILSVTWFCPFLSGKCLLPSPFFLLFFLFSTFDQVHVILVRMVALPSCLPLSLPPACCPVPVLGVNPFIPIPSHPGLLSLISLKYCFHCEHFFVRKSAIYTVWHLRYSFSHPIHLA